MTMSGSNFILSEPSDSGKELLSFTAAATESPKSHRGDHSIRNASKQRSVSFDVKGSDAELSFTATSPLRPHERFQISVEHLESLQKIKRHHILDEENVTRQHLLRLASTQKAEISTAILHEQIRAAELREASPPNEQPATSMLKYMKQLQQPIALDDVAAMKAEQTKLAKRLQHHETVAATAAGELAARKQYTADVLESVAEQKIQREKQMQERTLAAQRHQQAVVRDAAASKMRNMDTNRLERLQNLKFRHAFVALHGNYEDKVNEGDRLLEVRLAQVTAKVDTFHTSQATDAMHRVAQSIAERSEARRAAAREYAKAQSLCIATRAAEATALREDIKKQQLSLEQHDTAAHIEATKQLKEAEKKLADLEREEERSIFLNRMSCNETLNVEIERLRQQKKQQEQEAWAERKKTAAEKQRVAEEVSRMEKQNLARGRTLDKLMAEEAVVINTAKRQLDNRHKVEQRQEERILLLESEERSKRRVLDEIYRRVTEDENRKSAGVSVNDSRSSQIAAPPHGGSPARSESRNRVDQELTKHKSELMTRFPPKTSVLPEKRANAKTSLAFPTAKLLQNPPTTNRRLVELAEKLYKLENTPSNNRSDLSAEEREQSRCRLTQRSAAQEAQRFAYGDEVGGELCRDGPKRIGASARLYCPPKPDGRSSEGSFSLEGENTDDPAVVQRFVDRFYVEPLRQLESKRATLLKAHFTDLNHNGIRLTEKEISNVATRLYTTDTRQLSPGTEKRISSFLEPVKQESGLTDTEAAERFYLAPLKDHKKLVQELDKRYL